MVLRQLSKRVRQWWDGEYVPPPPNDPNSPIVFLSLGHYRRHWTSRTAHAVVDFYLREWRWLLPFLVGVAAALIAIKKL